MVSSCFSARRGSLPGELRTLSTDDRLHHVRGPVISYAQGLRRPPGRNPTRPNRQAEILSHDPAILFVCHRQSPAQREKLSREIYDVF
jgi:hypothetical protein